MSILHQADELLHGARQDSYGDPVPNYVRIGAIWGALLDCDPLPAHVVALMMAGLKLCRASQRDDDDDLIDAAAYLQITAWARELR